MSDTLSELGELILAALVIFVFLFMSTCVYNLVVKNPDQATTNNFKRLGDDITSTKNFYSDKHETMSVIQLKKGFNVWAFSYLQGKKMPKKCYEKTCICLYKPTQRPPNDMPYSCVPLEGFIFENVDEVMPLVKGDDKIHQVNITSYKKDNGATTVVSMMS